MSIYSGFATRRDESKYNDLLAKLIQRLQDHLLELADQELLKKKVVGYSKIVSRMREFEEHKYLPPKFSELLGPLCRAMGISGGGGVEAAGVPGEAEPERYGKIKSERDAKGTERFSNCKTKFKTKIMGDLLDFGKGANRLRKESTHQEYRSQTSTKSIIKKKLFESTQFLKQRRIHSNLNLSHDKVDVSKTYEEEQESLVKNLQNEQNKISASHPIILSNKIKASHNQRPRPFHALTDAQENFQKPRTPLPLRQEMRRKLKTTQDYSEG